MSEFLIILGFVANNIFWMVFVYLFVPGKKKQFTKEAIDIRTILELNKKKKENKDDGDDFENFVQLENVSLKDIEKSFRRKAEEEKEN